MTRSSAAGVGLGDIAHATIDIVMRGLLPASLALLSACAAHAPKQRFVGTYGPPSADYLVTTLQLRADDTFEMRTTGCLGTLGWSRGTWEQRGDGVIALHHAVLNDDCGVYAWSCEDEPARTDEWVLVGRTLQLLGEGDGAGIILEKHDGR